MDDIDRILGPGNMGSTGTWLRYHDLDTERKHTNTFFILSTAFSTKALMIWSTNLVLNPIGVLEKEN